MTRLSRWWPLWESWPRPLANFVVGPADLPTRDITTGVAVTTAVPVELTASWTGLDVNQRWLGVISYEGADAVTILSVG